MKGGTSTGRSTDSTELPACSGHRKAMVEAAAAGARRRDHQRIERGPAALVGVEAVANELAQEASALRVAVADDPLERGRRFAKRGIGCAVPEIRGEVANRRQAETGDWRSFGPIDEFVDADAGRCAQARRAAVVGELPRVARHEPWDGIHPRAKRERRVLLARIRRAILETEVAIVRPRSTRCAFRARVLQQARWGPGR